MNALFPRRALGALAFALALVAPGLALGQDTPPAPQPVQKHRCPTCGAELPSSRCPTCGTPIPDPVDRRLDEVLRREYGDPNGSAVAPPADEPMRPLPPPVRPAAHHEGGPGDMWEDDVFSLRLGMSMDAGLAALLSDRIRGRHSDQGQAQPVFFGGPGSTSDGHHKGDGGGAFSLHGSTWLDFGRYITVEMASSASLGRARTHHDDDGGNGFNGGFNNGFNGGNGGNGNGHHGRDVEFGTIDGDFIVHPVNGRYGRLDLILGGRYLEAREGPKNHQHTVEAGMPMVGIGGMLRPVRTAGGGFALELFARGEIGAMALGQPHDQRDGSDWNDRQRSKFTAVSATAEGGVRFVFLDMFGVGVGARFESASVEKRDSQDTVDKKIDWKSVGPFVALSMEM